MGFSSALYLAATDAAQDVKHGVPHSYQAGNFITSHLRGKSVVIGSVADELWPHRVVTLLQESSQIRVCKPGSNDCENENAQIEIIFLLLCLGLLTVIILFQFIHEDKEESITPLCPQLIVKDGTKKFHFVLDATGEGMDVIETDSDRFICKVITDWPDPMRPGFSGVAATVRLENVLHHTLATVVVRSVAVQGQGICLCRAGCEIFGFMETDEKGRYSVRYRTSAPLLTLQGKFGNGETISLINPVGLTVCAIQQLENGACNGQICQHVDAGLMLCTLFAAYVKSKLLAKTPPSPWDSCSYDSSALPGMADNEESIAATSESGQCHREGVDDTYEEENDEEPDHSSTGSAGPNSAGSGSRDRGSGGSWHGEYPRRAPGSSRSNVGK